MYERLNRALQTWREWRVEDLHTAPRPLRQLGCGLNNHSYLIASDSRRFALRLAGEKLAANPAWQRTEWQALALAHSAGLAPAPRHLDTKAGVLVCDYLCPDTNVAENLTTVGALLRRIHALPQLAPGPTLAARCEAAASAVRSVQPGTWQQLQALAARVGPLLTQLENTGPQGLCHNDLLRANRVISGGELWAIDWEYAATGPVWFDLAAVCAGDELDGPARHALLTGYLHTAPAAPDWQRLNLFECGYRYLELLWHTETATDPAAASLVEKQSRLAQCIDATEAH